jgi:hypothetical protein
MSKKICRRVSNEQRAARKDGNVGVLLALEGSRDAHLCGTTSLRTVQYCTVWVANSTINLHNFESFFDRLLRFSVVAWDKTECTRALGLWCCVFTVEFNHR